MTRPRFPAFGCRGFDATILHFLGIDHARFTFTFPFPFRGLQQRLTGVAEAPVVRGILA